MSSASSSLLGPGQSGVRIRMRIFVAPRAGVAVGPVKRPVTIARHQTSISLEPAFWQALEAAAVAQALPLSALVAQIDVLRIAADEPPNLASALRSWLFGKAAIGLVDQVD